MASLRMNARVVIEAWFGVGTPLKPVDIKSGLLRRDFDAASKWADDNAPWYYRFGLEEPFDTPNNCKLN